jgi:plasmid stabilization system protein ParE
VNVYTVRYRAEAQAEIGNAYFWFEDQLTGLGARFIGELETLDARIAENPFLYQIVEAPEIRRGLLRRFPYSLLYRVLAEEVDVLACFHQHQHPRTREELLSRA